MKEMYFDYNDYLLKTHLILQNVKRIGGVHVYTYARYKLAQLYILTKYSQIVLPSDFTGAVNRLGYVAINLRRDQHSPLYKTKLYKKDIDDALWYFPTSGYWYGFPMDLIKGKSLSETVNQAIKYGMEYNEENDDDWDDWNIDEDD